MAKISFSKPGAAPASPVTASAVAQAPSTQAAAPVAAPAPAPVVEVTSTVVTEAAPAVQAAPVAQIQTAPTPECGVPAVIPPSSSEVAKAPAFYDDESLDPGDLVLPRLNIVQKVGELSNVHPPGSIILGGQLILATAPVGNAVSPAIRLVILGFQPTTFVEKVEGGLRGNFYRTEQDVVKAGGTLDWNEHKATNKPLYQRLATALAMIEQPAGLDASAFPNELCGKRYALALYSMKGTAYTNAAKHFKSARKIGHLKTNGYRGGFWTFASQLKKFDANYAYIPVVKPAEQTSEELRAAVKDLIGF